MSAPASVMDHLRALVRAYRSLPDSREKAQAIARLEESAFWASLAIEGLASPIEFLAGEDETKPAKSTPKS